MAEPYLEKLTTIIENLEQPISEDISLECKHFFSGAALYANSEICAILGPLGFALKLPAGERNSLIERGEAGEFRHSEKGPVKKEYALLAGPIVDDAQRLAALLKISTGYATGQAGEV